MNRPHRVLMAACLTCALSSCKPVFKHAGTITVDGARFEPMACHVLGCRTGIELLDAGGGRLELELPPEQLQAWREIKGTPHVVFESAPGKTPFDLGSCGVLSLSGEGWHEAKGRAASGHMSLSCAKGAVVRAEFEFSGCF